MGIINLASKTVELTLVIVLALLLRPYWAAESPSVTARAETPADRDEPELSDNFVGSYC